MEGGQTNQLMQLLTEIEAAADDILVDKQQIIDLDRRRQKTREAQRILAKDKKSKSQWMCIGNMFLKLPQSTTKKILDKVILVEEVDPKTSLGLKDFDNISQEIRSLEKGLKPKVSKLRDLEKEEDIKGFNLNPLSKDELKGVEVYCD